MATLYDDFYVVRLTPDQLRYLRGTVLTRQRSDQKGAEKIINRYKQEVHNLALKKRLRLAEECLKALEEN